MLVLTHEQVAKLDKAGVLNKCVFFSTGKKSVPMKEYNITTEPLKIAPQKELLEAKKAGAEKTKRLIKKYVKSVQKEHHGGLSFVTLVQMALKGNKIPVLLLDETQDTYEFEFDAILAALKSFGVKPYTLKTLKKEKVLKGKKKAAKKKFLKLMNDFSIAKDKDYDKYKGKFLFEILMVDAFNQYSIKDKMNKDTRAKYAAKLMKIIEGGKKKKAKKELKNLKKLLKIESLDMPSLKKVKKGNCDAVDLLIVIGHMAALRMGEFGSKEYLDEMTSILTSLDIAAPAIKSFAENVEASVKTANK